MFDFEDVFGLQGIDNDGGLTAVDLDGDGIPDALAADTDGDGILDTNYFDTDGDGYVDMSQHTYGIDSDGDGIIDMMAIDTDYGMDGSVELTQYMNDLDNDGILDTYGEAFSVDLDGDGVADILRFSEDTNMDGIFDVQAIVDGTGNISFIDQIADFQDEMSMEELTIYNASQLDRFNPNNADPSHIIGNPEAAMEVFHTQETPTSCAVAAQEFVLEQLTGREYTETDLRNFAEANQWYSPEDGTPLYNTGDILESQGLSVKRDHYNTIDDIAACLENGGAVIVGVDAYEIYGVGNDYGPGMDANHALQVIGIDTSSPGCPMVIVNDPSNGYGGGAMIPMDNFMDAWADSECFMVEAYPNV